MTELDTPLVKPRILIADDSKVVRVTAVKILGEYFDIVAAEDGQDAWEKLNADTAIQVVVTDLGMPNVDGYELIQKIRQAEREETRNLPIMVITGNAEDEAIKKKVLEVGATDFVTKPFAGAELVARLKAHASYSSDRSALQKNTDVDLLTETLNRKALQEKLEKDISFVTRHKQSLVVILFELDNYKNLAETTGQESADIILKNVAKVLSSAIRREDSFGRFSSATFMAILPMAKIDGVVMLVKRLCEHIKSCKFKNDEETINLTLSAGVASLPKGCSSDVSTLIKTVEQALNNARDLGSGEIQMLKLDSDQAEDAGERVSIDDLLKIISSNSRELKENELADAERQLAPLLALFSAEQRKRLLG